MARPVKHNYPEGLTDAQKAVWRVLHNRTLETPEQRERRLASQRRYDAKHREEQAAYARNARAVDPVKFRALSRAYYAEHPEQWDAYRRTRNALKRGGTPHTSKQVVDTYGTLCHICDLEIDMHAPRAIGQEGWETSLHIDHVVALFNGGSDSIDNVRPAHGLCNLQKGTH